MEIIYSGYSSFWIIQSSVFDPRWWLLFGAIFIPWLVWWKLLNKKRLFEILCFGLLWGTLATWLDLLGTSNGMWRYPIKLYDKVPTLLAADISVVPVLFMLVYQFGSKWKSFLIGSVLISLFLSFVMEPLFIEWRMLELIAWSHAKSFFAFVILAICTKWILLLLGSVKHRY